ncbi:MAG: phosphoribosylglycinamide formyltransferase [Chlorobiaceae bacterium]|nr:phosphoribosylglycinamide formyltransferase [Chlorobiaceae bacterium]
MPNTKKRLAVFCSGSGSNFQALFYAIIERALPAEFVLCLSNRPECGAMDFAREQGMETLHLSDKQFGSLDEFAAAMVTALKERHIDYILLAGYMRKVPEAVVRAYADRILNIHPALLPQFGGEGMYGINVHTAVIEAGETESGATVHMVNEEYDKGRIVMQGRVPVLKSDTPEILAARVLECEHTLYPDALEKVLDEHQ